MSLANKSGDVVPQCGAAKDGRTKQADSARCDINAIVARYRRTGFMEHQRKDPGIFADVSRLPDFHSMVRQVRLAQEGFDRLPAALRARFGNDPGKLIEFCSDVKNSEEAVKLGILPKPKAVEPVKPVGGGDPPKDAPASAGGRPVVSPPVKKAGDSSPD